MIISNGTDIIRALQENGRVYYCGKGLHGSDVQHIETDGLEIGVTLYDYYKADKPHVHTWNREYNIVLDGEVKVYIFAEKREYSLRSMDMFVIETDMAYICKAQPNSRVLFVKSPGGNDKQLVAITPAIQHWMDAWDNPMNDENE